MHPTVFDNLKTVLEGSIYDFESQGMLEVVLREDFIDLANLTRSFKLGVSFEDIYGQIEINFPENMWTDEVIFSREKSAAGLSFIFEIPKPLHATGYLQWFRLISQRLWNVEVQLIEEKKFSKNQIALEQKLCIFFKEELGEMNIDRLMDIADHFIYIGERILCLLGQEDEK